MLIKEIIKNGIYHGYDKEQIKERIIQAYEKMDYPTAETARLHAMDTYRQVMRYLSCESRKPAVAASQKLIDMDGLCSVEVRPDFIFRGYRNFERVVYNGEKTPENNCAGTISGSCKDMLQSSGCITDRKK